MAAVQALPCAPAVYASPVTSSISLSTPMTVPWGAGALHQRLNAFVKKSLIKQLVPTGAVVCDFYCGRGVDTDNWAEAQIGKYVGIDLSSSALEEAKEQWEKNGKRFAAKFCELNPCMVDLEKNLGEDGLSADVVTCLAHLQDCFAAEDMVRQLLKNVSSLLKPGGYFFGATPDSSTIWYKYQKAVEGAMKAGSLRANGNLPRVRTDLYSISFDDDRFNQYGSRYQLRFTDDTVPPQPQILVHFPSLIRHAEEFGLEYVEIQNLTEFYEDYRVPFAETLQNSCGTLVDSKGNPVVDGKSRLSPVAQDVLSLYTTFIFKKPDPQQRIRALKRPAPPTTNPGSSNVKKIKRFSPASLVQAAAAEDTPFKKRRVSGPVALPTSNGSKLREPFPKQEKRSSSGTRSKLEIISKNELYRSSGKTSKTPDGDSKLACSQPNLTESKIQERSFKPEIASSESRDQFDSVEKSPKLESLSVSKPNAPGSQKTEVSSVCEPNALGQRIDGPSSRIQDLKAEVSRSIKSIIQGSSEPELESPSSSGLPPRTHLRTESVERDKLYIEQRGNDRSQSLEPVKRKRVSRWSSDYVPKVAASTGEQMTESKDQGGALQQPGQGILADFSSEHQLVTGPIGPQVGAPAGNEGDAAQNSNNLVHGAHVSSGGLRVRKQHSSEKESTNVRDVKSQQDERCNHKDLNIPLKSVCQRSLLGSQEYRNERGSIQRRDNESNSNEPVLAERGVESIEEGEVITELPVRKTSSPNRDKPVAVELHYERRSAQRSQRSGTMSGSTHRREIAASDPRSERSASGNPENTGSESWLEGDAAQNNDNKAGSAIPSKYTTSEPKSETGVSSGIDAQLHVGSKQEISSCSLGSASNINDQKQREFVDPLLHEAMNEQKGIGASTPSQEKPPAYSEAKKENLNPKPRKKEIVMDVLMDRTTNQSRDSAAPCATQAVGNIDTDPTCEKSSVKKREPTSAEPVFGRGSDQNKDFAVTDADLEKGFKSSRNNFTVEHQSEIGSTQKRESGASAEPSTSDFGKNPSKESVETDSQPPKSQGFKRDNFELPWEAKPQRYPAPRRATPQMSEGSVENPPLWHRGNYVVKVDRDSQGRGPVIYPRNPYANSGPGFAPALRPPLRATTERRVVVPPLQGGAGLLGAAPSPSFVDRGLPADRRFDMMGPPEGGRGYNDHRGPRPIRGSLYKDRVPSVSRVQPDFAGEGNNGLGGSWDDHFPGDGRTRNR